MINEITIDIIPAFSALHLSTLFLQLFYITLFAFMLLLFCIVNYFLVTLSSCCVSLQCLYLLRDTFEQSQVRPLTTGFPPPLITSEAEKQMPQGGRSSDQAQQALVLFSIREDKSSLPSQCKQIFHMHFTHLNQQMHCFLVMGVLSTDFNMIN